MAFRAFGYRGDSDPRQAMIRYMKNIITRENVLIRSFYRAVIFISLLFALLSSLMAHADTSFTLSQGWRDDHLDFNLAGVNQTGTPVNILSQLTWRDIQSYQVQGTLKHDLFGKTFLEGTLAYGAIFAGANQDSDYNGNNGTDEYSRSNNAADVGHTADGSLAIGQQFLIKRAGITGALLAGYGFDQQDLYLKDGVQTIPASGPFPGMDSSYDARWSGPWLGVEGCKKVGRKLTLNARAELHWAGYTAQGDWNLISNFAHPDSFTDRGHGVGDTLSLGATYALTPAWQLHAQAGLTNYTLKNGTDTLYFSDDSTPLVSPLNAVHWRSLQLSLGLGYRF